MDHLFELIKSMSKNEKRHFKLFYSTYSKDEKSNHVKLFNAIDKLEEDDTEKLLKILDDKTIENRLAVEKNFLYRQVLKSLRTYHSEKSVDGILKNLLLEANVLYNRSLYDQCEKILNKAEKLAIAHEKFLAVIEVCQMYRNIYYKSLSFTNKDRTLESIYKNQDETVGKLNNLVKFQRLQDPFFKMSHQLGHTPRNEKYKKKLEEMIAHPLLKDKSNLMSDSARIVFNAIHSNYALSKMNYKKAVAFAKDNLQIMESDPAKIEADPNIYIRFRYNYLLNLTGCEQDALVIKREADGLRSLGERYSQSDISQESAMLIDFGSYFLELSFYYQKGFFDEAGSVLDIFERKVEENKKKYGVQHIVSSQFLLGGLYFATGNFEKSLKYLNAIAGYVKENLREDMICIARIIILIVYFELGDEDMLHYATRSTYRYLLKREQLHPVEKVFLDFIRTKMKNIFSKTDLANASAIMKKDILSVFRKHAGEDLFLDYFDLISWLDSKIENKIFAEIVKKKALR